MVYDLQEFAEDISTIKEKAKNLEQLYAKQVDQLVLMNGRVRDNSVGVADNKTGVFWCRIITMANLAGIITIICLLVK